ncbi:hypothetical protein SAMN05443252_106122 [Bacillus sp. OV322]|nr:hypothetical protein SAMN05443252_106122 [Bacillus sp. OV322]
MSNYHFWFFKRKYHSSNKCILQKFLKLLYCKGKDFEFDCMMNTFGSYNIANALAAIAVGLELQVPIKKI